MATGNEAEIKEWYQKNGYQFSINYVEDNVLFKELKINRFPFIFCLENSIVVKKGPFVKEMYEGYLA